MRICGCCFKGKDPQVVQSVGPSGSCPQAASLQLASEVYPAARRCAQHNADLKVTLCAQHSAGLHLLGAIAMWVTNSSMYNSLLVRISARVYIHTYFASACKKLLLCSKVKRCIVFKSAHIKNLYMSTANTPLYRCLCPSRWNCAGSQIGL